MRDISPYRSNISAEITQSEAPNFVSDYGTDFCIHDDAIEGSFTTGALIQ